MQGRHTDGHPERHGDAMDPVCKLAIKVSKPVPLHHTIEKSKFKVEACEQASPKQRGLLPHKECFAFCNRNLGVPERILVTTAQKK